MPLGPSPASENVANSTPIDPSASAFDAAHKALLSHRDIQFDFPSFTPPPPPGPLPTWLKALGHALGAVAPAMPYIFWTGVGVGVLFLLYLIIRELGGFRWARPRKRPKVVDLDYRPDAAMASALLADADELAAQGLFAEAVHSLLLRSIDDMRTRRPRAVQPSLTTRDINALSALPDPARPAFAAMAQVVERSLFGGAAVDRGDFDHCRQAYEAFAFPKVWS
jgi:hypothetical protein